MQQSQKSPLVALTFDDGPNTTTTVEILDLLNHYHIPASFFLVGNNITPATVPVMRKAYDMGCELDNHSKTHSAMPTLTREEILAEVTFVSDKIKEVTGEPPLFFRPPYIAVNDVMYETISMPFICGAGCNDWDENVSVQERIDMLLNQLKDGTIILLHDAEGNIKTVDALKILIPMLLEQGYRFVTVKELFTEKGVAIRSDDTSLHTYIG